MSEMFQLIGFEGKGLGAVATKDIKRGTLILKELPQISVKKTNDKNQDINNLKSAFYRMNKVLIFCVEFRDMSHLTRDLSQAEKKINVSQAGKPHKMTSISLKIVEVVILSEDSCHFVSCSACNNSLFVCFKGRSGYQACPGSPFA